MRASEILKRIETVNPDDGRAMREIDCLVRLYVHRIPMFKSLVGIALPYTRSRDALKGIRPDGWEWYMSQNGTKNLFLFGCAADSIGTNQMQSPMLATEELAELHAIIQAIAYEREEANENL